MVKIKEELQKRLDELDELLPLVAVESRAAEDRLKELREERIDVLSEIIAIQGAI